MTSLENRMTSLAPRFDLLLSKIIEIDERLTRLETRLER
jgi:hypothetical protein